MLSAVSHAFTLRTARDKIGGSQPHKKPTRGRKTMLNVTQCGAMKRPCQRPDREETPGHGIATGHSESVGSGFDSLGTHTSDLHKNVLNMRSMKLLYPAYLNTTPGRDVAQRVLTLSPIVHFMGLSWEEHQGRPSESSYAHPATRSGLRSGERSRSRCLR